MPPPTVLRRARDIVFSNVGFSFAAGRPPVLDNVDAMVPAGRRVALIGPSGAGKSTLLGLAAGLVVPDAGRVLIGGAPLAGPGLAADGARIGLLSQDTRLFAGTIAENLRLGRPEATDIDLMEALDLAGFLPVLDKLGHGLESRLGEGGRGLSGGEQRRLALARLVVAAPDVWLLDEPTEGLDAATAAGVAAGLARATEGATTLIVTHLAREAGLATRSGEWTHAAGSPSAAGVAARPAPR
ncbi:putative ABC transporter ATP-binding protein [Methylobrevis pamukkalensis]|uniref:Putative ABC transporter ATP-binding protein n=1 Tax=Methylobrevis pamukkalensis TaxID=1439726 RepID=A0A1E3H8U1_9HYPH|nr:putative ABC transporter ATP-binding protein [Methylobrevis pamukkalensis]